MPSDVSYSTWTGVASCALSCGCFFLSVLNDKKAQQIHSAKALHRLSDLKELLPLLPLLVAISGKAYSAHPIKCELSDQQVVLRDIRETEHSTQKSTNGTWQPEEKLVRYTFATADWELQDSSSTVVAVHEAAKADDLHMATVGDVYVAADSGREVSGLAGLVSRSIDVVQGFKVLGHHRVERALPMGTRLTAIGELVNTDPTGSPNSSSFAIQQPSNGGPYVISKLPLREVITSYHAESHTFKLAAWAFGGVGVAILGTKAAMFGWSKWRDRRIRQRREAADRRRAAHRAENAAAAGVNDNAGPASGSGNADHGDSEGADENDTTCVICLERRCNTVFQACGHMCTCDQCSSHLNRCPICRTRTRAIRVYYA